MLTTSKSESEMKAVSNKEDTSSDDPTLSKVDQSISLTMENQEAAK